MTHFQMIAVPITAILAILSAVVAFNRAGARRGALVWTGIWLIAAAAVMWPESTQRIAGWFGIGRGVDLVLYCFVIFTLGCFYMMYVRMRRLDMALTQLVRAMAIQTAQTPQSKGSGG